MISEDDELSKQADGLHCQPLQDSTNSLRSTYHYSIQELYDELLQYQSKYEHLVKFLGPRFTVLGPFFVQLKQMWKYKPGWYCWHTSYIYFYLSSAGIVSSTFKLVHLQLMILFSCIDSYSALTNFSLHFI